MNSAVVLWSATTWSKQGLSWPAQAPLQDEKSEPAAGVAVSVTHVPLRYDSEQSAPQSMPAGSETTVPVPGPVLATATVNRGKNSAISIRSPDMTRTQGLPWPAHSPNHDVKTKPAAGLAVSVTTVPFV